MSFSQLEIEEREDVSIIYLQSGNNNAIGSDLVKELTACFGDLAEQEKCRAVVLTSKHGKFFSPGLDLFEVLPFDRPALKDFMLDFNSLLQQMYSFPKPLIAALNGHTIAGGLCLSLACDFRIMANCKAYIGLNELKIGICLPYGVVQMLLDAVGPQTAKQIAFYGSNYLPVEALELGIIDECVEPANLLDHVVTKAQTLAEKSAPAFSTIKDYLKRETNSRILAHDATEVERFLDVWFSDDTQNRLQELVQDLNKK